MCVEHGDSLFSVTQHIFRLLLQAYCVLLGHSERTYILAPSKQLSLEQRRFFHSANRSFNSNKKATVCAGMTFLCVLVMLSVLEVHTQIGPMDSLLHQRVS
ncbi:hypothetical protein JAB6_21720 [Janthinobacterium sp. HH104]|nr:hypothetical protein JAB6_21720 [Janthinobacterium sp. HH104]